MILTGDSLAERQHDLNSKVNDAAAKEIPLDEFKEDAGTSDVDKLFKIDLASKYKNVGYIIEVLKSGDELHISRAIKCLWLYDAAYKSFINPKFLQEEVFPSMSKKMMKKFLVTISTYVSDEDQAQDFYEYCMKRDMKHYAFNFLVNTSVAFKTEIINNKFSVLDSIIGTNKNDIILLVGNDFSLAEAYQSKRNSWYTFRHLYSVDAVLYLSKCEAYFDCGVNPGSRFGLRTSKDIMVKHKSRIVNKIHLYYRLVNYKTFLKYTTYEDAKKYAVALLPESSKDFWSSHYRTEYKTILDIIPDEEKYHFFKKIYTTKYPESEFEMAKGFYEQKYYYLMTVEERESWALRYIEKTNKSFLSECEDKEYLWYRFVNYDRAIPVIKKYVLITPEPNKRAQIVELLIECTRNQDHLQKMFEYCYERHVNEDRCIKESFIKKVVKRECIWEFNEKCWETFNKLLHSIELFNEEDDQFNSDYSKEILIPVLFYHVINEQEFPKELKTFVDGYVSVEHNNVADECIRKIKIQKQRDILYEYLKQMCIDKIKKRLYDTANFGDRYLKTYIEFTIRMLNLFEKTREELPEVVNYIISISKKEPVMYHSYDSSKKRKQTTMSEIIRELKENVNDIPDFWEHNHNFKRKFKKSLLKKLKVYFSHDLAHDFIAYFSKLISDDEKSTKKQTYYNSHSSKFSVKNLKAAVFGIFLLADDRFKAEFMTKYAPADTKIDYKTIDRKHLYIQEAICHFVYYSRPRVSLDHVRLFIKGDYIHYCLPLLYNYATNLPSSQCPKFVRILLNAPVSMQKHGLKLAFECFSLDNLKELVLKTWKVSKNISLRKVIYTHLFENIIILKSENEEQMELFEVLLTLTSQLNEEDHRDVLDILTNDNDFPEKLTSAYLQTAWKTVNKFPDDDKLNLGRKVSVLDNIRNNIRLMHYSAVHEIVNDFVQDIKEYILHNNVNTVTEAKYNLTTTFIAKYDDEESVKNSIELVRKILATCFEMWNDYHPSNKESKCYFSRSFCHKFIHDLECKHFSLRKKKNTINILFETIAQNLLDALPVHEVFSLTLRLRFIFITNIILGMLSTTENNLNDYYLKNFTSMYAAQIVQIISGLIEKQQFNFILMKDISEMVVHFASVLNDSLIEPKQAEVYIRAAPAPRANPRRWVRWNPKVRNQFRGSKPRRIAKRQQVPTCIISVTQIDNILTFVAKELVTHETTEAMLLALDILPVSMSPASAEEYKYVFRNVKKSADFAVQASLYQKTIRSSFQNIAE